MQLTALFALLSSASALMVSPAPLRPLVAARAPAPQAMLGLEQLPLSLIAEIVDADGERAYGAVEAPGWVLPTFATLAILTSLLPILLSPGEEAFQRQQADEASTFGNDKGGVLRGSNRFNRNKK